MPPHTLHRRFLFRRARSRRWPPSMFSAARRPVRSGSAMCPQVQIKRSRNPRPIKPGIQSGGPQPIRGSENVPSIRASGDASVSETMGLAGRKQLLTLALCRSQTRPRRTHCGHSERLPTKWREYHPRLESGIPLRARGRQRRNTRSPRGEEAHRCGYCGARSRR